MMEKPKHEQSKEEHDDTIGANQRSDFEAEEAE